MGFHNNRGHECVLLSPSCSLMAQGLIPKSGDVCCRSVASPYERLLFPLNTFLGAVVLNNIHEVGCCVPVALLLHTIACYGPQV